MFHAIQHMYGIVCCLQILQLVIIHVWHCMLFTNITACYYISCWLNVLLKIPLVGNVIYLDFVKAFDKINHFILLNKLKNIGINLKVGVWIQNLLPNRQQCVAVNRATSSESQVKSGVSQGSVLGPLLFVYSLYIYLI